MLAFGVRSIILCFLYLAEQHARPVFYPDDAFQVGCRIATRFHGRSAYRNPEKACETWGYRTNSFVGGAFALQDLRS
jgi:hypothetical protein